ncbi:MAG: adenylyl-sulfate kinase, partial [Calditrichaeota bacterium]|nr:adenylyl-sulfate kinase [Calditrichota bacterium]
MTQKSSNIYWHEGQIKRSDRERVNDHRGACIWFTGLSGSGKSTLANAVEEKLFEKGIRTYVL